MQYLRCRARPPVKMAVYWSMFSGCAGRDKFTRTWVGGSGGSGAAPFAAASGASAPVTGLHFGRQARGSVQHLFAITAATVTAVDTDAATQVSRNAAAKPKGATAAASRAAPPGACSLQSTLDDRGAPAGCSALAPFNCPIIYPMLLWYVIVSNHHPVEMITRLTWLYHSCLQATLDDRGAPAGCSALDARYCLVVARSDAISVYTRDARGPVFVFPGAVPGPHAVISQENGSETIGST